jgi:hypothetical protein
MSISDYIKYCCLINPPKTIKKWHHFDTELMSKYHQNNVGL